MKRTKCIDSGNNKNIIEEFESYDELLRTTSSREVHDWAHGDSKRHEVDDRRDPWSGERTYQDAVRHLKEGCETSFKLIKTGPKDSSRVINKDRKPMTFNNVIGFQPNVPAAIMGLPKSMIDCKMTPKRTKIIDLIYDMTANCGNETKALAEYGAKILKHVVSLEQSGYRVRLSVVATFAHSYDDKHVVKVKLKSENQPLDMKRVSYPLAGKGMFRRIMFDWYESCPEATEISGYGSPMKNWTEHEVKAAEELKNRIKGSGKTVYIMFNDDLEDIFEQYEAG